MGAGSFVGLENAVPEPGEDDGGGFAESGGDVDELGVRGGAGGEVSCCVGGGAAGEAALVGVGMVAGGGVESGREGHKVSDFPCEMHWGGRSPHMPPWDEWPWRTGVVSMDEEFEETGIIRRMSRRGILSFARDRWK